MIVYMNGGHLYSVVVDIDSVIDSDDAHGDV